MKDYRKLLIMIRDVREQLDEDKISPELAKKYYLELLDTYNQITEESKDPVIQKIISDLFSIHKPINPSLA
jgi:hypothetical protein